MSRKISTTERLKAQGFDLTRYSPSSRAWWPRCSQCEVLVINGVACHETGCPNIPRKEDRDDD